MVRRLTLRGALMSISLAKLAARAALLLLLAPALAAAQRVTGTVAGRVTARADSTPNDRAGLPLVGATVTIIGSSESTTTDSAGRFLLPTVVAGRATVRVHFLGYRTTELAIVVAPNDTTRVAVALEREAVRLAPVQTNAAQPDAESFTAKPNVATIMMPAKVMAGVPAI